MNHRSWPKTLRLVLRQGVNSFDEANGVSLTYLLSLCNILERLDVVESYANDNLPGRLNKIPDLHDLLTKKLRKQSQDTLKEIGAILEQMEVSFKIMKRFLNEADGNPEWNQSQSRNLTESIVCIYGHEYWRKKQLIEAIDLSQPKATQIVNDVLQCWSPDAQESYLDPELVRKGKELVRRE
mmetsp:Transcript_472/g.557  ORF Transcript_472/g.557 Transcript_472/m.557 type:complete len:182 (-) Transcript_472:1388-1933(-)|eukprot:CAMPEP_0204822268 /NCGR_PEP_ID=MMETSP1346-20131115/451_1 /ASSEMBLY_ACC=CAM_ASM_000771 /TAXON_ID=215587 /ORGANISM="Aplanochytrium stocchinoi, Strain GSBS06" /LENGTH=181 /DNA_ID=CAMNT_0051948379 /DNA_START=64 /DNA_END=609 /DNA_ORIENTATION=-